MNRIKRITLGLSVAAVIAMAIACGQTAETPQVVDLNNLPTPTWEAPTPTPAGGKCDWQNWYALPGSYDDWGSKTDCITEIEIGTYEFEALYDRPCLLRTDDGKVELPNTAQLTVAAGDTPFKVTDCILRID